MSNNFNPTKEQINAIEFPHDRPAVVTAAAGSGKTTLLAERVIRIISDMENPINAGTLAVVTFTVNATQSIREKLNLALQSRISELLNGTGNYEQIEFLSEQMLNLRNASISTINAFCLNFLRENFQAFDLPINFTIADETKKTSMQMSSIQLAMRDFYDENSKDGFSPEERNTLFFSFNFENDKALFDAVVNTAEKLCSCENAEEWLNKATNVYSSINSLEKNYINIYVDYISKKYKKLKKCLERIENLLEDYETETDLEKNEQKHEKKITVLENLSEHTDFDCERFTNFESAFKGFADAPSINSLEILLDTMRQTPENTVSVSRLDPQNSVKKRFNAACKDFQKTYSDILEINVTVSEEELTLPQQKLAADAFAKLVRKYVAYYGEIKRTQGCIDFSDCELLLLDKLKNDPDFRSQLSQKFSCIIVDEFQDSNDVQAEIFRLIGGNHLFFVGDVKQSIYAFRGGNPMIMSRLCKGGDGFTPLPLNKNFRSRKQIIDVVNAAFSDLMTEEYGGVDYADKNALDYGADYPDDSDSFDVEICALDFDEKDETASARYTAELIKKYINDENFYITKKDKKVRPTYSDFTILMRKNGKIKLYREALAELNIPSVAPKGSNFLLSEEIVLMINLLKVIDDPLRDEETLNVLMSPLYRLSAEEVAEMKLGILGLPTDKISKEEIKNISSCTKKYSLYNCAVFCVKSHERKSLYQKSEAAALAEKTENELNSRNIFREINGKAKAFLSDIDSFRCYMSNNSLEDLLCRVFDVTDIFAVVSAFDDSRQRISNLHLLETIASDFVSRECGNLSDFLRFLDKSMQNDRDIEGTSPPEDAANSVKIMTFHGSKGLESPICILTELDSAINLTDSSGSFLINHQYYFSMDYVDRKNRFREKTFSGQALKIANRKSPIGEELRLLYVAMTRAREKLIMIGRFNEKTVTELCENDYIPEEIFEKNVPFYWILSSLCRRLNGETIIENCKVKFSDKIPLRLIITNSAPVLPVSDNENEIEYDIPAEEVKELAKIISKPYKNAAETKRQAKFSATELAHKKSQIPFTLTKPAFALSDKKRGTDVGNAYHHFMQHISIDAVKNSPDEELDNFVASELYRICDEGKITEDESQSIDTEKICEFFRSNIGKRLLKSDEIEREFPFYAEIESSEIDEDLSGTVGIQGQIDLFFTENGKIIVVDYKTDFDAAPEKDAYSKQVKIYAKVLPLLTGKQVSQTYLYLFSNGETVEL